MSNEQKNAGKEPHMEKSIMTEPMEEFVADQSVPSKSMQSGQSKESGQNKDPGQSKESSPQQRAYDVKPAGHENKRMGHNFEPGVEG